MTDNFDPEAQASLPVASPYCSDPNCVYCKELRETQEEVNRVKRRWLLSDDAESR